MNLLERKKLEVALSKCHAAKAEIELRILEKQEEIARCEEHIKLQITREKELLEQLQGE